MTEASNDKQMEYKFALEEMRLKIYKNAISLCMYFAIVALLIFGLNVLTDIYIKFERLKNEESKSNFTPEKIDYGPSADGWDAPDRKAKASSQSGLQILQQILTEPLAGNAQGGNVSKDSKVSLVSLFKLIDRLVTLGAVPAKEANELRKKLTDAAIDGGKEILVDAAKKTIDKVLESSKSDEPKHVLDAPSDRAIHINQYCGATATSRTPTPPPPVTKRPKKSCPKANYSDNSISGCKDCRETPPQASSSKPEVMPHNH